MRLKMARPAHVALAPRAASARAPPPAGKLDEAEPLYREALKGRVETLGRKHPDTLDVINNLASLLQAQGAPPPALLPAPPGPSPRMHYCRPACPRAALEGWPMACAADAHARVPRAPQGGGG